MNPDLDRATIIDACTIALLTEARRSVPVPTGALAAVLRELNPDWDMSTEQIDALIREVATNLWVQVN